MKKILITEHQFDHILAKQLTEAKDYYDFWDTNYVYETLQEFLADKEKGVKHKKWTTIPFEQYRNALIEFTRYGRFMRFPTKYIDRWADIVTNNTLTLQANTELCGHTTSFPFDEFCDTFGFEEGSPEYEKYYGNYEACGDYLEELGFYDWTIAPDGTDAISDYGLDPLLKLIAELEEQNTPEQKLVVINKILDVYHWRGDLASLFLQGGTAAMAKISGQGKINEQVEPKTNSQLADIANKLVENLNQLGIGADIWHAATTGSVYIRFDDNRMGSIRLGDHPGRDKLKYKFNIRTDLKLSQGKWVKDEGKWRYYLPANKWKDIIDILIKQHAFVQKQPESKFNYTIPKHKQNDTLEEMAYPDSFSMEKFKAIRSYAGRIEYCKTHLQRIAQGSSRMVFKIDEEKVLKLAMNAKGIVQNETEASMGADEKYFTCIAYVFDYDEDKNLYVEMEKAEQCSPTKFKEITGYDFNLFVKFLKAADNMTLKKEFTQEFIDDAYNNYSIMKEILEFADTWDLARGDLYRLNHYGIVKRNGEEFVVLIDYGITAADMKKLYSK